MAKIYRATFVKGFQNLIWFSLLEFPFSVFAEREEMRF